MHVKIFHYFIKQPYFRFFIVFVWGLPLCFFVSMTVADEALPMSSGNRAKKNAGICKRIMENFTPGRGKSV